MVEALSLKHCYCHSLYNVRKTCGKFLRSYSELLSKFGDISFQEHLWKGISHPVFYGDLVYKLRRVKHTLNFISSGSKIIKRLRRQYDPVIIERTIGLVLGPLTALYSKRQSIALWQTRVWGLHDGPCQTLLRGDRVLIFVPSDCKSGLLQPSDLNSLPAGSIRMSLNIFLIYNMYYCVYYVYWFLLPLRLVWLLVCCLYKEVYLQMCKCMSFWLHGCCGEWEGWPVSRLTTPVGWL